MKAREGWLSLAEIPNDFAVGTGKDPLYLTVAQEGETLSSKASKGPSGDIVASTIPHDSMTMLTIKSNLDKELKFDLYISPDGRRFQYTSTCALIPKASNFESWPYAIHSFAIGNVRIAKEHTCD